MTEATNLQQLGTSDVDFGQDRLHAERACCERRRSIWPVRSPGAVRRGAGDQHLSGHGSELALQIGSEVLAGRIWSEGPKLHRDPR